MFGMPLGLQQRIQAPFKASPLLGTSEAFPAESPSFFNHVPTLSFNQTFLQGHAHSVDLCPAPPACPPPAPLLLKMRALFVYMVV